MDIKFPAFVKDLARKNGLSGDFYFLKYNDAIIYLTKQQHDDAVKYKWLDVEPIK